MHNHHEQARNESASAQMMLYENGGREGEDTGSRDEPNQKYEH